MMLLTKILRKKLIDNGHDRQYHQRLGLAEPDCKPVVKLFTPDAQCTWLLTEIDPDDPDRAFGLCDLGMGSPELGYVSIAELESVSGPMGLPIERDQWFTADITLSEYADKARSKGRIFECRAFSVRL